MRNKINLRDLVDEDLIIFFNQQNDAEASRIAAFTSKDPTDKNAFMERWGKIRADSSLIVKTILYGREVAGHVLVHNWFGDPEISYWIGREFWNKGIASKALAKFLQIVKTRPLFARVVHDNTASIKVLERSGFKKISSEFDFANARNKKVKELIYKLG